VTTPAGEGGSAFDRAIAGTLRSAHEEEATYDVVVDPGWTIGDKPNGGYLLALLGRAAVTAGTGVEGPDHPHPLSATAHFISAPSPGPAEVRAEVLRRGRQFSQVRARLVKDGFVRVEATFTLGRLDPGAEPWWTDAVPPEATPPERCPRSTPAGTGAFPLPLMDQIDLRLDPAVVDVTRRTVTGRGEHWGWWSLADGRAPDPLALLLAVDALPPATIGLGTVGWVPTLSLTAYVRGLPAPGPLLVHIRARLVEDDLVDETCDVWDGRGRLVAQATQLAAVRTP
jgi:acyl-coenzyme A thioesterase PaaI-like protein